MAIVTRIKAGVVDPLFGIQVPVPTEGNVRGRVRLWHEDGLLVGTASNKFIVIGDDIGPTAGPVEQRYGEAMAEGHTQRLTGDGWQKLLADRGISIDDYADPSHKFNGAIFVPTSIIDFYTG